MNFIAIPLSSTTCAHGMIYDTLFCIVKLIDDHRKTWDAKRNRIYTDITPLKMLHILQQQVVILSDKAQRQLILYLKNSQKEITVQIIVAL
jgi:hypothetical protein